MRPGIKRLLKNHSDCLASFAIDSPIPGIFKRISFKLSLELIIGMTGNEMGERRGQGPYIGRY